MTHYNFWARCEIFDVESVEILPHEADTYHGAGKLAFYEGKPTTVSCDSWGQENAYCEQKVETYDFATGWSYLEEHPVESIYGHSLIGLDDGSLLMLGGKNQYAGPAFSKDIWLLSNGDWTKLGSLREVFFDVIQENIF